MSEINSKTVNNQRRKLLLGSLAAGAAGLLQACGGGGAMEAEASSQSTMLAGSTVVTPSSVPANQVRLADYGGVPGASSSAIISAFNQAFNQLKNLGGGTLLVGAGKYNLGNFSSAANAISVSDLQNVLISAYGAQLTMNTTAVTMPVFIHFQNPNNVTIAGMSFYDSGTDLSVNWRGAVCLSVNTTYARSGFKTVDCLAENVVTFVRSYGEYTLTGMDIHGTVRNAYYGVNPNRNGRFSKCDVTCDRVRRGFLGYGARDWDITLSCTSVSGALGSNGFVDLIPDASSPSQDCTIKLTVTGNSNPYGCLIHFYHQGTTSAAQHMRNVKAHVTLNNATGSAPVFLFDHEPPTGVVSSTIRTWEQMVLTGSIVGSYAGPMIRNPSISTGSTNSVSVASNIAALQNMSALPKYFTVFTAGQCSA